VRKKLKLPPEAPDAPEAPEAPVKHHYSRKAEKKTKMSYRTPRKPRTASTVVCNLLTHRLIASRTSETKDENELQKAQNR